MGEILYMENQASRRDQTLLACAAQQPKLLPPPERTVAKPEDRKSKLKASVQGFFDTPEDNQPL